MQERFNENIEYWLTTVFKGGVLLVSLLTIFFFWNLTTEFYETPKFFILAIFLGLLLLLSTLKYILEGKVTLKVSSIDLPLIVILTVAGLSAYFSASPQISIWGAGSKIHGSLISLFAYILFYFVLVNNIHRVKDVKQIISLLVGAGALLAVVTLLSFVGIKILPAEWTHTLNFTPTGSSFSTASLLALLLPFPLISIIRVQNHVAKIVNAVILAIYLTTIVLIGSNAVFAALGVTIVLVMLVHNPLADPKNLPFIGLPVAIALIVFALAFVPSLIEIRNPLYTQAQNFPREIQLPIDISWKVSVSAFRDAPFWGTGPSTYLYDFTSYKPAEFNNSKFWNIRFDQAFNEYFNILATLGGVGFVAFITLTAVFVGSAFRNIFKGDLQSPDHYLKSSLAISGILFFVILALHSSTLVLWVTGVIILASFVAVTEATKQLRIRFGATGSDNNGIDALPALLLIVVIVIITYLSYSGGKYLLADYHHRKALNAVAANNGLEAYNQLVKAENFNPLNDLYRTDIAQTNFALANAIAATKGPTEGSPSGSLTDQDKQNIQQLLQQAITEGRAGTTLNIRNAANWEILGSIYRQISGVAQNALSFALDSYGQAIQRDPLNPLLRITVGGIYYSIQNYDLAIRFFTDAVNLKPDYANGYYNLSIALRDKGDLQAAQSIAERMMTYIAPESTDFKTATDYLKDLKSRVATGSAAQSQITSPAAAEKSALQKQDLPKVLDLPKPKSISTPAAIKK